MFALSLLIAFWSTPTVAQTLDAANIDQITPNTWTRLTLGPNVTRKFTENGQPPPNPCGMMDVDVQSSVPISRPYVGVAYGSGKLFYFGGGHSGYSANDTELFDVVTGRWTRSNYIAEFGCDLFAGALSPNDPTPGGRPWWEHQMTRLAWDNRELKWMVVQESGTWFYAQATQTWQQLQNWAQATAINGGLYAYPGGYSSSDWLSGVLRFDPVSNRMLFWSFDGTVYFFHYGTGAPSYTGARWTAWFRVADLLLVPTYDADAVYDTRRRLHFYMRLTNSNPRMWWFDPMTATGGELTMPDVPGNALASLAYDPINDAIYCLVPSLPNSDLAVAQLWRLKNPRNIGGTQAWSQITGLGTPPALPIYFASTAEGNIIGHTIQHLHYDTVHGVLYVVLRSGGGSADGRGGLQGGATACLTDACFRMWGLKIRLSSTSPSPPANLRVQ